MTQNVPPIGFLGLCDSAAHVRKGPAAFWSYNLVGLRTCISSWLYPHSISESPAVFAIYNAWEIDELDIRVVASDGREALRMKIGMKEKTEDVPRFEPTAYTGSVLPASHPIWSMSLAKIPLTVMAPGEYAFLLRTADCQVSIGHLEFVYTPAQPLTADRVAALNADPRAMKFYRYSLRARK